MQPTTRFHDGIANPIRQEADVIFHNPRAFHTANDMFHADSDRRDPTIGRVLRRGEVTPTGFFLGLDDRAAGQDKSLEAHILIETTSRGPGVTRQLRQAFIVHLAFIGRTQEAHVTGLIDHKEVFERGAFLLATVILLLVVGILRAVDGSFRTIRPNRGGGGDILGLWARQERRARGRRADRPPVRLRSRLLQHRREEMKPPLGRRWGPPQALSVHGWDGLLLAVGQPQAPRLSPRRHRRGVLRTLAPARARWSS